MTQTHFGFKRVESAEKASLVRGVFDAVAPSYDRMNDAMSVGLHRWWKQEFVSRIDIRPSMRCLDVAGGTGDIAFRLRKRGVDNITICDINHAMLEEGRARADNHNMLTGLHWLCGNAESLPLSDNAVNLYTIAFGIRNVTDIDQALSEAFRVLSPGGRFLCLEFSAVSRETLAKLYHAYSFHIIPKIGKLIAKNEYAYQYLVESIRQFPNQETFAQKIKDAGFSQVRYNNLSGGVVAIHSGYKI